MIVSFSSRFIFVHIHKCAGTSIELALGNFLKAPDLILGSTPNGERAQRYFKTGTRLNEHATAQDIQDFLGHDRFADFTLMTCVRDPVNRIRSLYKYIYKRLYTVSKNDHIDFEDVLKGNHPQKEPYIWNASQAFIQTRSFAEFIQHPKFLVDDGARRQIDYLTCDGIRPADIKNKYLVFRTENLDEEWQGFCSRSNIKVALPHSNKSTDIPEGIDPDMQVPDTVMQGFKARYEDDYRYLGYSE